MASIEPGAYEEVSQAGSSPRPYWMIIPSTYDPPTAVPLFLHLASGTGDHDVFYAGWEPYLDDIPGLMALVNTADDPDTDELKALIDDLAANYCIDPKHIHVLGMSWSGGMAESLACHESETIASFVAALSTRVPTIECRPDRQVPLLTFTGDIDRLAIDALVETWVGINGCDPEPVTDDLGSGVVRKTYESCAADVVYYDIAGMGHKWPLHEAKGPYASAAAEYDEVDYLEEAMQFFAEHPLP